MAAGLQIHRKSRSCVFGGLSGVTGSGRRVAQTDTCVLVSRYGRPLYCILCSPSAEAPLISHVTRSRLQLRKSPIVGFKQELLRIIARH